MLYSFKVFLMRYFQVTENNSTFRTECVAGITTFLTMAYIILVNPAILASTGMNLGAAFIATCLSAALGSFLTGVMANYPIAVAPGMALNVYFAYVIVGGLGYSWESCLGAVFISGVLFFLLTVTGVRQWVIRAIPESLTTGICAGIGLFIALIALKTSGIVISQEKTLLTLGHIDSQQGLLFLTGFCLIVALDYLRIPGAMLIGILFVTLVGILLGINHFHGIVSDMPSLSSTWMKLDIGGMWHGQGLMIIFTFFLVALFDSAGTLVGVLSQTPLIDDPARHRRVSRALVADSIATIGGSLLGTSTTSPYIESAAGVRAGGRTGLTAVVVALLFLGALFFSPLAATIPDYATGPALLFVASLMVKNLVRIPWEDFTEAVPGVITFVMIPFTFSIADGIGLGFISYTLIKLFCGKWEALKPTLILLTLLFVGYFIYRPVL